MGFQVLRDGVRVGRDGTDHRLVRDRAGRGDVDYRPAAQIKWGFILIHASHFKTIYDQRSIGVFIRCTAVAV